MSILNEEMEKFGTGIFYLINSPDEEEKEGSSKKVIWVYSLNNDAGGSEFHEFAEDLVDKI